MHRTTIYPETVPQRRLASSAPNAGRLRYLDGIRGLAAIGVAILYHYQHFSNSFQPDSAASNAAPLYWLLPIKMTHSHGFLAVDVFFMMSGYIFAEVYVDDLVARRLSGWTFATRRFARLYPIHLLTLLTTAVLVYAFLAAAGRFPVYPDNGVVAFIRNLLFVQGETGFNGPAWSLSVEGLMYAIFYLATRYNRLIECATFSIAGGLGLLLVYGRPDYWAPLPLNLDFIRGLVGFFLGLLINRVGSNRPLLALSAVGLVGVLPLCVISRSYPFGLVWLVFGVALLAFQRWPILRRPLEMRALLILGDLSLAIYLVHFPVQVAILLTLHNLGLGVPYASCGFLLGYAALVLTLATAVHYGFEMPAQRWIRRHADQGPSVRSGLSIKGVESGT